MTPRAAPRVAIAYDCLYPLQHGGGERVYGRIAEILSSRGSKVTYVTRFEDAATRPPRVPYDVACVWRGRVHDDAGNRTTTSAIAFAAALFRFLVRRRSDYDLVMVAALPVLNVFAARLALLGSGTRLVVDWLEVWPAPKWRSYAGPVTGTIAWALQSLAARMGHVLTVNSSFTRDRLRALRRHADPIVLGLVDLAGEEPEASVTSPASPTALFVGRHIREKRLEVLPAALSVARRTVPGLRLLIAGSGPETPRLRAAAAAEGVADSVDVLGRVDEDVLRRLMIDASVLVNPSAREGFGLVVVEAAAAGTPSVVVAGEDNAAADLVIDGVNGEVSASADAMELGNSIARVVLAGEALRRTTLDWFRRERVERGLERSVDAILDRALPTS